MSRDTLPGPSIRISSFPCCIRARRKPISASSELPQKSPSLKPNGWLSTLVQFGKIPQVLGASVLRALITHMEVYEFEDSGAPANTLGRERIELRVVAWLVAHAV